MTSVVELWLPILLSAIAVFLASFVLHMVLKYHENDVKRHPAEDEVLGAIRRTNSPPGDYVLPHANMATMNSPEFVAKRSAGPVALMTVLPGGPPEMKRELVGWFIYAVVVSIFAAYMTSRALAGDAAVEYLDVFRFAATTAFLGYGLAQVQESIWWGRSWNTTLRNLFDALVYALLTGGIFGWLFPGT